jgi:hypothetical protein
MSARAVIGNLSNREFARYLPVFLLLFVIGIAGGRAAGMVFKNRAHGENGVLVSREMGISQRNLAVLIVDQLQSPGSRLEGIWLLISAPDITELILVPVHPDQVDWAASLIGKFTLTEKMQPGTDFLDHLTDLLLWDHYLLIDRYGINSIMSGAALDKTDAPGDSIFHTFRDAGQLTLEEQTLFWGSICDELASINNENELEAYFKQFSQNGATDLYRSDMDLLSWINTADGKKITCEFPTLEIVSP